ncbi:tetratricopeptide repeat protein [Rhodococcus aerolatus]
MVRTKVLAIVMTVLLVAYLAFTGQRGVALVGTGTGVGVVLGLAVLVLPLLGVWMVVATYRQGTRNQHLARRLHDEGGLPDTSELPRRPSGRIVRDAADEYFAERLAEYEAAPEDWRTTYRLAVAYDTAGDRSRARGTLRRAVDLEAAERAGS